MLLLPFYCPPLLIHYSFYFLLLLPAQAVVANITAKALNKPFISFIYYSFFLFSLLQR